MADIVPANGIHQITGMKCDLCGSDCDSKVEELNFLTCASACCPPEASMYHQHCIEKFLKQMRVERNRKTGFECPRGKGKGTGYETPCNGKIQKSHPVHIRNDGCANRRKAKLVEPAPAKFVSKKERRKAAEAEAKPVVKDLPAKQQVAVPRQPAMQPIIVESKQQGKAVADPQGTLQGARKAAAESMPVQQLVEKKALAVPAAQPHVQPSHDALRAAKLANRRELGLPVSPLKPSAQQTVKPQGRGARLLAGGQKAASGNPAPTSSIWRNPTTKQTGSVISTSPPVSNVSDLETASSLNPDWTSHDEAELLSPRVPQSSQKQLRRSLVAKGTASEAASSPMTPNAIKAFQPVPSEHDDETLSSVTTPTAESLLGLHQDKDAEADAESFSSDIDQDHLFCLDGGSSSDSPEMFLLDSALVHDFITFPDLHTKAVEGSKALQLEQQFLDVLALQKAHKGAAEYQMLGFSKQQSVAAVNKFGDNMELGVSWLLRTPEQYLQECDNHVPLIDITEEVQQLANFQQAGGMSTMELYRIVTDPKGTTDSLKAVMLQWIQLHKAHSASQLESNASEDLPAACAETENVQPGQSPSVSTATAAQAGSNQCQTRSASPSAHHLMHQIVGFSVSST